MIPELNNIIGVPSAAFVLSIAAIMVTYGRQMVKERFAESTNVIILEKVSDDVSEPNDREFELTEDKELITEFN